jgi:hypothetical protein
MYHYGWDDANIFLDWIDETKDQIRIYFVLGDSDTHLALLVYRFTSSLEKIRNFVRKI